MSALYFEEFQVGALFDTSSVLVDTDMVSRFAALTGDRNPIHEGERGIVHGMLLASLATGLISGLGLTRGTLVAMIEQHLRYLGPVRCGETVHVRVEVVSRRRTGNPEKGIVEYRFQLRNELKETVLEGNNRIMVFTLEHRDRKTEKQE